MLRQCFSQCFEERVIYPAPKFKSLTSYDFSQPKSNLKHELGLIGNNDEQHRQAADEAVPNQPRDRKDIPQDTSDYVPGISEPGKNYGSSVLACFAGEGSSKAALKVWSLDKIANDSDLFASLQSAYLRRRRQGNRWWIRRAIVGVHFVKVSLSRRWSL